ncbi:DNA adenine methylase [Erwinia psidii]|uniref:site-specific DNA-methyltransferase (adenine-specific) n=1 Tax=Erwinia psidii TaxID=69224 RepID=A0A3N6SCL3_9GAMM|nr:Dam family site-specific DNA-(adenine-N6)-methyltransferase [Erwinia psidii]RQM39140.1 Dam family site-specific DNA-(adenine-N6)-methyltransferase [Erwinia psidii]
MIRPPLKWAGGKTRVLPDLMPHLPKASMLIEPFVGGASVFLNTEYRRYILADINIDLINLYRSIKRQPEYLIYCARNLFKNCNNSESYYSTRWTFNAQARAGEKSNHGALRCGLLSYWTERAAVFLYLNRHCFNGVCRYNIDGDFNVPYGKYKVPYFPETEIRQFSEKANDTRAIFLCASFERTLQLITDRDAVVESLIAVNQKFGVPVIISNSDTAETREIYKPFNLHELSVNRSVGANATTRGVAKEVIGVLKVCDGCGPCCGDATYKIMQEAGVFNE